MTYSVVVWIFYLFVVSSTLAKRHTKRSDESHLQKRTSSNIIPRNCHHAKQLGHTASGVYEIDPRDNLGSFNVYCDMETDRGGWTVFQRRKDGSENFNRKWQEYVEGFGNLYGEFWLGLDKIHRLAASVKLRVDLMAINGDTAYAQYDYFTIGDNRSSYALYFGNYNGTAGDSLSYNRGMKFSTLDRDHDKWRDGNCAGSSGHRGGWWYDHCSFVNLNSLYEFGGTGWYTVTWDGFKKDISLQRAEMKLK